MKPIGFVVVCALLAFPAARPARALDFTLSTKSVEEDGYPRDVSYFAYDEHTTVIIRAPARWQISSTSAALVMTSQDFSVSEVRLEKSPFTPGLPFKDQNLERYRQHALTQVPIGSTEVLVSADSENPLPIFDWTGHEFSIDYTFYGQRFKRAVLFLNLDATQQLRLNIVGPASDFDRIHKAAYALMHHWQASSSSVAKPPR